MRQTFVLLCVLCACSDATPTRTIVRFRAAADLTVPQGTRLHLVAFRDGVRQHEDGDDLGSWEFEDGIELPVEADSDDAARRFTIFAELRTPDDERLSWARVRSGFVQDERRAVLIEFQMGCPAPSDQEEQNADYDPDESCGSHDTCYASSGGARCASACVEPVADDLADASPAIACPLEDDIGVDSMEVGWDFTCALGRGESFCWSHISFSTSPTWRLASRTMTPELRTHFRPGVDEVVDMSASIHVSCIVLADGTVRCGGGNTPNQDGVQNNGIGVPVEGLSNARCCTQEPQAPSARAIESVNFWTCIVTSDEGDLWCTGYRPGFAEAVRTTRFERTERDGVVTTGWTDVFGGPYSLIGLREERLEWFVTNGDHFDRTGAPPVSQIADIDMTGDAMCIVTTSGQLQCWGNNPAGARHTDDQPEIIGEGWSRIAIGERRNGERAHRCGIRDDGTLWCWGDGTSGELSEGNEFRDFSQRVQVGTDNDWVDMALGRNHTCGIREGGHVYCWGSNISRQLGVDIEGNQTSEPTHVPVPGW